MANGENNELQLKDLRGDAVGDTLYSERWILKLLMRLTKYVAGEEEYDTSLERDLCTLWDMCAERDVVLLLRRHGMLGLIVNTVMKSEKARLTEIMIGILGNMCVVKSVREECEQRHDIVKILLDLLSMPDAPTLIQVMRVLQNFAWDVNNACEFLLAPSSSNDDQNHSDNNHQDAEVDGEFVPGNIDQEHVNHAFIEHVFGELVHSSGSSSISGNDLDVAPFPGEFSPNLESAHLNGGDSLHSLTSGSLELNNSDEENEAPQEVAVPNGEGQAPAAQENSRAAGSEMPDSERSGEGINSNTARNQMHGAGANIVSDRSVSSCDSTSISSNSSNSGSVITISQAEDTAVAGTSTGVNRNFESVSEPRVVAPVETSGLAVPSTSGEGARNNVVEEDEGEDAEVVQSANNIRTESFAACDLWFQQFSNFGSWLPEIVFILNSSKNEDLLQGTWTFLQTLCYGRAGDTVHFSSVLGHDIMRGLIESHKEFFGNTLDEETDELDNVQKYRKGVIIWTAIVYGFTLNQDCLEILCQFKADIMKHVFQILRFCTQFLPLDEHLVEYLFHSFAILREVLFSEPRELSCLRTGVFDTLHLLDELTAIQTAKQESDRDFQYEKQAIEAVKHYLRAVLSYIIHEESEEFRKQMQDVRAAIVAKNL